MRVIIRVEPAPEHRRAFARWGIAQSCGVGGGFRTVSHAEFAVPEDLFVHIPEELLAGALVDGHPYPPPEDTAAGVVQAGTRTEPEPVEDTPLGGEPDTETPPASAETAPEVWPCDRCGREFGTQRGLNKHRSSAHPEGD